MTTESNEKKTCFVIGPIGEPGTETRNRADTLLEYIIKPAVKPLGYKVWRADHVDDPGTISDRIVNDTLDSDLVIADLTNHNANAFYELGIRHNEGRPTVHMLAEGQDAPFDLSDQRHVKYSLDNPEAHQAASTNLRAKIEATHEEGYLVQNPVTRARGHASLSTSEDPKDQMIANIMDSIGWLKREVLSLKGGLIHQQLMPSSNDVDVLHRYSTWDDWNLANLDRVLKREQLYQSARGIAGLGALRPSTASQSEDAPIEE
jgi:hypothetical protein